MLFGAGVCILPGVVEPLLRPDCHHINEVGHLHVQITLHVSPRGGITLNAEWLHPISPYQVLKKVTPEVLRRSGAPDNAGGQVTIEEHGAFGHGNKTHPPLFHTVLSLRDLRCRVFTLWHRTTVRNASTFGCALCNIVFSSHVRWGWLRCNTFQTLGQHSITEKDNVTDPSVRPGFAELSSPATLWLETWALWCGMLMFWTGCRPLCFQFQAPEVRCTLLERQTDSGLLPSGIQNHWGAALVVDEAFLDLLLRSKHNDQADHWLGSRFLLPAEFHQAHM